MKHAMKGIKISKGEKVQSGFFATPTPTIKDKNREFKKNTKNDKNQKKSWSKEYSKNDQFEKKGSASTDTTKAPVTVHKEILLIPTLAEKSVKKKSKAESRKEKNASKKYGKESQEQKTPGTWSFRRETTYSVDALPRVATDELAYEIFDAWLKDNFPKAVLMGPLWGTKVTEGNSTDRSSGKAVKRKTDGLLNAGLVIGDIWEDQKSQITVTRRLDWETNGKALHLNIEVTDVNKKTFTKYLLPIEPQTEDDNNFKIRYFLKRTLENLDKMPIEPAQEFLKHYRMDSNLSQIKKFKAMLETIPETGSRIYEAAEAVERDSQKTLAPKKSGTSPLVKLTALTTRHDTQNKSKESEATLEATF